jgi:basic membrane protein A and related proteins
MSRKWFAKATVVALALSVVLAGCGGKKQEPAPSGTAPTPAPAAEAKKWKVGMATDLGGLNDESFNQAANEGLKKLEKEGVSVRPIESKKEADYEPNFRSLMEQKYDLIWGIGFLMHDALDKVAKENPTQKFAIIDEEVKQPNVASVKFREEEGSFLMGIIAAKTTKTKKVGFVGGMDIDVIHHFDYGFKAGVKTIDPTVQVITVYTGSFTDAAKGKDTALSMISQGADVIFHASGNTGTGAIEAAASKKVFAIGVDKDQNSLAKEYVISSMMKRVDNAVYNVSKAMIDGKFAGGTVQSLGLKEDGVGYAPSTLWAKMPADTKATVDQYADAIKAGKFTVPADKAAFDKWAVPKL